MSTAGNVVHICEVGINPERVACNVKLSSCQVGNQNREKLRIKPFERWSRKERRREPQTSSIQSSRHGPRWWSLAGLLARLRIQNFQSYLRSIFHGILYEITIKPISGSKCGSVDDDMTGPRCATSYRKTHAVSIITIKEFWRFQYKSR